MTLSLSESISFVVCSILIVIWFCLVGSYSPLSSSDLVSPVYPDRPIRPLPKRRLRTRLSPEVAESLQYPPEPNHVKPLFYLPYNDRGGHGSASLNAMSAEIDQALAEVQEVSKLANQSGYQFRGNDDESEDEDGLAIMERRYQEQRHLSSAGYRPSNKAGRPEFSKLAKNSLPASTASSIDTADGYDSFENTNNKKKRKIPTSGSLGVHQSSLSTDMASMGISPARDTEASHVEADGRVGQYYGTGSSAIPAVASATGLSGPGRGRFGRVKSRNLTRRSPLAVSPNGSNTLSHRGSTPKRDFPAGEIYNGKGNDCDRGRVIQC